MMKNRGFTLLEVMFAVSIFTVVMGILFGLSMGLSDSAGAQNAKMIATEESRRAIEVLLPHLIAASRGSLVAMSPAIPGNVIVFQEPPKNLGAHFVVNVLNGLPNLATWPTVRVEINPTNPKQLIMTTTPPGAVGANPMVQVLCNNLVPNPTAAAPSFQITRDPATAGFFVQIQNEGRDRRQHIFQTDLQVYFMPRN